MTLRKGHGKGAGVPRIEVMPPDELPDPVAAPQPVASDPIHRRPDGKIADSAAAKALGAKGGLARVARARLAAGLGIAELADTHEFKPYRTLADEFVKYHLADLALQCGGTLGPGPSSIVASAGLQLAFSRWVGDKGIKNSDAALIARSSTLMNDSRQNLLAAYELGVREAQARKASKTPANPLDMWMSSEEKKAK